MTEQEQLKKSIDSVVEKILATDKPTDQKIEKAAEFPTKDGELSSGSPEGLSANGGKDRIKNDSPLSEEEKMMGEKKKKEAEAKKAQEDAEAEKVEKAKMKKDDDCDDDKDKDDKKKPPFMKKMKKSIEELSEHLDEDEIELIKAWREQPAEQATAEDVKKSMTAEPEDKTEQLKKALTEIVAPLQKAIEDKDTLIKSLGEKIEKMASQPAYDRRSISSLETLEKSGEQSQTINKSQVTEKLLALQLAGKGVNSHHIAEFEATGNISDPSVKAMVFKELKLN